MVSKPNMGVQIMTLCECYTKGRTIVPTGIVVHSTGANNKYLKRYVGPDDGVLGKNQYNNHWNRKENSGSGAKGANAFIGCTADGTVMPYQTLPWNWRPWLCGSGSKGSYNNSHIQFEMCEDGLTNATYWRSVRAQAVHLCAWLCQEYNIDVKNVVGHYEAYKAGYASNHGDPRNWMSKFGDSMENFRADVRAMMNETSTEEENTMPETALYQATVQTKSDPNINLWRNTSKPSPALKKIPRGAVVDVLEETGPAQWKRVSYDGATGYADGQYLVRIEAPVQPPVTVTGDCVVIKCGSEAKAHEIAALMRDAKVGV